MIKGIGTTALLLAFVSGSEGSAQQTGIGYKRATDADSKKTILLKDFHPEPALHAAVHEIERAKFPVIDVHTHTNDAVGIGDRVDPKEMIARMDRLNIRTIVILTGMWGDKLQTIIDDMVKPYPGRFVVFTQFDWSKINDPNFSQLMVRQIDDSVARGARGLKVLKELGLGVRDSTGKLINDRRSASRPGMGRMRAAWHPRVYSRGRSGSIFSSHRAVATSATRSSSSIRIGASTARSSHPCKSCSPQRDRMFAKHPHTTFVALHFGSWPENLDFVEQTLQKFPNVMIETGAREGELGRQPRRTREIFLKYSDRIMFGTDEGAGEAMYQNYFRWLETEDEYFPYAQYPLQGRWMIYGMGLPDDVLEKVYHRNAETLFARFNSSEKRADRGAGEGISGVTPAGMQAAK